jgi:hypothetical protein
MFEYVRMQYWVYRIFNVCSILFPSPCNKNFAAGVDPYSNAPSTERRTHVTVDPYQSDVCSSSLVYVECTVYVGPLVERRVVLFRCRAVRVEITLRGVVVVWNNDVIASSQLAAPLTNLQLLRVVYERMYTNELEKKIYKNHFSNQNSIDDNSLSLFLLTIAVTFPLLDRNKLSLRTTSVNVRPSYVCVFSYVF